MAGETQDVQADRETDARVAEHFFNNAHWLRYDPWPHHEENFGPCDGFGPGGECSICTGIIARVPPAYTSDPAADYLVLQHVRETWNKARRYRFERALLLIWQDRRGPGIEVAGRTIAPLARYCPGDYARAALAALDG